MTRITLGIAAAALFAGAVANLPERRVAEHRPLIRAIDVAEAEPIHATTEADLAVMRASWTPIVGLRAQWCRSQDSCRR